MSASRGIVVEITPSPSQFGQLARDLALLARHGDASHTDSIVKAVGERADRVRRADRHLRAA